MDFRFYGVPVDKVDSLLEEIVEEKFEAHIGVVARSFSRRADGNCASFDLGDLAALVRRAGEG